MAATLNFSAAAPCTMARVTQTATGKVFAIQGRALARGLDGKVRWLDVGDLVQRGETIVTSEDGYVQLVADTGPVAALSSLMQAMGRQAASSTPNASDLRALSADAALRADPAASSLQEAARVAGLGDAGAPFAAPFGPTAASLAASRPLFGNAGADAAPARSGGTARAGVTVDRSAPTVADTTVTGVEDQTMGLRLGATNPGASAVQVHVVTVPTGGVLYTAAGRPIADGSLISAADAQSLRFAPAPNFHGDPGPVVYSVIDTLGRESAVARVNVVVQAVNDAPVAGTAPFGPEDAAVPDPSPNLIAGTADYRYQTAPGVAVAGLVRASDIDLDPLRFSATDAPAHGSVAVTADGRFVYTPDAGHTGSDRFVITVDDGRGGTSSSTVFIDVLTAPAATPNATPTPTAASADALTSAHGDAASAALAVSLSAGLVHSVSAPTADRGLATTAPTASDAHAAVHAPFGFLSLQDIFHGRDATLRFGSAESSDPSVLSAHRLPLDLGFGAAGGLGDWAQAHPNG